jgi:Sulfotransferase domain
MRLMAISARRNALIQLSYRDTYHGFSTALDNPQDSEMWLDAMLAKYDGRGKPFGRAEFDCLLGHCQVRLCPSS